MAQSLAKVYLHAIFSTRDRLPVLTDDWREDAFQILGGIVNNIGCQSLIVGGVADHVHLLFQLARTVSISDCLNRIKSTSSLGINQSGRVAQPFHWQSGYAVFSVSQSMVETVRNYIFRQPEHHRHQTFQDELREWLRKYEMEGDERYLWD